MVPFNYIEPVTHNTPSMTPVSSFGGDQINAQTAAMKSSDATLLSTYQPSTPKLPLLQLARPLTETAPPTGLDNVAAARSELDRSRKARRERRARLASRGPAE